MEASDEARAVPPYLPYRTLRTFLDSLRQGIPARIDRTVMRSFAGSVQSSLLSSLRYLNLITPEGIPTDSLNRLVHLDGLERQQALAEVLRGAYNFLFSDGFSLERATPGQFQERFRLSGATGDTARKAATFFLAAARDAGMEVSPFLEPSRTRTTSSNNRSRTARTRRTNTSQRVGQQSTVAVPESDSIAVSPVGWHQMLLAKFPSFDPSWAPEVQAKWFDMFDRLMRAGPNPADDDDL